MNLDDIIYDRIKKRIPWNALQRMLHYSVNEVYVGGNSLNRSKPNDIDLFPVNKNDFVLDSFNLGILLSKTPNALTLKEAGVVFQLCSYHWNSLKELVDSFDFAHIQIGARINIRDCTIQEIYYSENWKLAHQTESTWFTGSAYPLSSLMRISKYIKREEFSEKSYVPSILSIVASIVTRGFENYTDFKQQLDAVDLGLLPEDMNDVARDDLMKLFEALRRDK